MKREYEVGFLVSRVAWAMNNSVNRMLKENGLPDISVAYFAVLNALWESDGMSITDLGEKVQLEKSTMTSLLDRMEAASLVRREDHPTDRRAYQIFLAPRGRELEEKLDEVAARAYKNLTRGIPEEDLEIAGKVFRRLIQNAE